MYSTCTIHAGSSVHSTQVDGSCTCTGAGDFSLCALSCNYSLFTLRRQRKYERKTVDVVA